MKTITYQQIREITVEVTLLRNKLMELGLLKTFHEMDATVKQIGWEVSEILEGNHPTKLLLDSNKEE